MSQEKEKALEAIRNLIAYYTNDFKVEFGEVHSPKPNVRPRSDIRGLAGEDRV